MIRRIFSIKSDSASRLRIVTIPSIFIFTSLPIVFVTRNRHLITLNEMPRHALNTFISNTRLNFRSSERVYKLRHFRGTKFFNNRS